MTKIIFCQATWRGDFEDTKKCIERVSPHVDTTVITVDSSLTEEQVEWLNRKKEEHDLHVVVHEFGDNFPEMRNSYLEKAKELEADWICVSDPDELYSEELASSLRRLIDEYRVQGYNLLPVPARDQFESIEWLDELDLLKETPGGYRETDYWKPILIYKVYPDTHYEGVGETKLVHESLRSAVPWNAKNLPKEYYYTHRKSALRIWRNAARNMFIGGGGDNVGTLNPYWVKLRQICSRLGAPDWASFEELVKEGSEDEEFRRWLIDALWAPPTNWGTETRETAKLYYALHPEEITTEIKNRLENPPKMTPEIEVENYVTRCYFETLGRHPDEAGKKAYVEAILSGRLKREDLPAMLRQSPEFKQRFAGAPIGPVEIVKMQVPVSVDIQLTPALFLEAMKRSDTYSENIKPKMDLGDFVLGSVKRKKELLKWFYANREDITIQDLLEWLLNNALKPDSVAMCIMGYKEGLPMIEESVRTAHPYVDEIHVQGDDFTDDDTDRLRELGATVHIEPWVEDFSGYKNKCVARANTEWVMILDHDEIPTLDLSKNLRDLIKKSDRGRRYNMVQLNVIDVKTVDGELVEEHRSPNGKALLHWNVEDPYYANPHIWLKPNYYPWKVAKAPLAYRHVKAAGSILPRSVRNVFYGGGGDNTREGNPLWVELRNLTKELRIDKWKEFHAYLKRGTVDPRLLDVLKRLAEMPWKDNELGDPLRYYFKLHPEEKE